jgi:GcrA cell cycle regulator
MAWNAEQNALLDQLIAEECDIVTMQQRLGKTREAIRNKLKRMGVTVTQPAKPVKEKKPRRKKPVVAANQNESEKLTVVATKPARKPRPILPVYPPRLYPIEKIGPQGCQWPIGDLRQEGFHFCGADRAGSGPYCRAHAKIAFNGTQVARVPEKV